MEYLSKITPVPISQYDDEFIDLLKVYDELKPMSVLEIGTHYGGTFYHWITRAPNGAAVNSIDNQHINANLYDDWADERRVEVNWFRGNSIDAFAWANVDAPYDFIFIDGDHSYQGVLSDWVTYKPLIAHNGIIAFHDITPHPNRQVDLLWEDIKLLGYKWEEIIDMSYSENERCGIGIIYFD